MFFNRILRFPGVKTGFMIAFLFFPMYGMAEQPEKSKDKFVLVVDAGHGGHDVGAHGEYALEKDINLNVALDVVRRLRANPDIQVVLTRQSDVYLTLDERAQIANKKHADLFVSIHTNSSEGSRMARGTETYFVGDAICHVAGLVADKENSSARQFEKDYEDKYKNSILLESARVRNMDHSELMARLVQEEYIKAGARVNRGVQQARFYVLMNTLMPAILTEVGFISTWDEESYLTSQKGVEEVSSSIYNAILAYKNTLAEGKDKERLAELKISRNAQQTPNVPIKLDPSMGIYDETSHLLALAGKTAGTDSRNADSDNSDQNRSDESQDVKTDRVKIADRKAVDKKTAEKKTTDKKAVEKKITEKKIAVKAPSEESKKEESKKKHLKTETDKAEKQSEKKKKAVGSDIHFYVQLMATREELPQKDKRLKGLWPVRYVKKGNFYKCLYFENNNYQKVRQKLKTIASDFPGAYVVAYQGEEEMTLSEAVKKVEKKN